MQMLPYVYVRVAWEADECTGPGYGAAGAAAILPDI